jgi:hypothetical protein
LLSVAGALGSATAFALAGCGGSNEASETVTVTVTVTAQATTPTQTVPDDSAATTATTEEPPASKKQIERSFGGVGADGDVAFSVKSWRRVSSVLQSYESAKTPVAGAAFVEVTVSYENRGKKALSPFCGGQGAILIDEDDRNFNPKSEIAVGRPGSKICDELQPGFKRTDVLVFEIPKSARENSIAVFDPNESDDFLNETYVIFAPK